MTTGAYGPGEWNTDEFEAVFQAPAYEPAPYERRRVHEGAGHAADEPAHAAAVSGALVVVDTANNGTAPARATSPPITRPGPRTRCSTAASVRARVAASPCPSRRRRSSPTISRISRR